MPRAPPEVLAAFAGRSSRVLFPFQLVDVLPRSVGRNGTFGGRDDELSERAGPHVADRVEPGQRGLHALVGVHVSHVVDLQTKGFTNPFVGSEPMKTKTAETCSSHCGLR